MQNVVIFDVVMFSSTFPDAGNEDDCSAASGLS